jgi:putative membrane protein
MQSKLYPSTQAELITRGRKDFTSLISNSRNLSRVRLPSHLDLSPPLGSDDQLIWIAVCLPSPGSDIKDPSVTRAQLRAEKKALIRLVVAFVVATKHHLRAEGGVHHDDLRVEHLSTSSDQ